MSTLFDRGAQNERTRLAWQRTSLSMMVCGLLVARLVATEHVLAGVLVALCALGLLAVLTVWTRQRYAASELALRTGALLPDARVPVAMTLLLAVVGLGGVVLFLTWL